MGVPVHSRLRRTARDFLSRLLARTNPSTIHTPISETAQASIQRILVVRINYRIGNVLFITPLLRALNDTYPHAQIDVLIGAAYPAPLLSGFPTVRQVFDFPRKLLKNPLSSYRYLKTIRATEYDAVLCVGNGSGSDRLATRLVRARYKIGFEQPNDWAPFTHVVAPPTTPTHEALKPLWLMRAFGHAPDAFPQRMDIALSTVEREQGRLLLTQRLAAQGCNITVSTPLIGLFRDARFEKKISDSWWLNWFRAMKTLHPDALFIDILSPDVPQVLDGNCMSLSESNLRILGSMLTHLSLFVCADTGPMHLASAAFAPTAALFKHTAPTLYGTLGTHDVSLEITDLSAEQVAARLSEHVRSIRSI